MKSGSLASVKDVLCGIATLAAILLLAVFLHTIRNLPFALTCVGLTVFVVAFFHTWIGQRPPIPSAVFFACGFIGLLVAIAVRFYPSRLPLAFWFALPIVLILSSGAAFSADGFRSQRRQTPTVIAFTSCAVAIALAGLVYKQASAQEKIALVRRDIQDFVLTDADGVMVPSQSLRGEIVVLDFWATWCAPCIEEMPALQDLAKQKDLSASTRFLTVAGGVGDDSREKASAFALRRGWAPNYFDSGTAFKSVGGFALPYIVVLDRNGKVRYTSSGFKSQSEMKASLKQAILLIQSEKS